MSGFDSLLVASLSGADRSSAARLRVECTVTLSEDSSLAFGAEVLPHIAFKVFLVAAMWAVLTRLKVTCRPSAPIPSLMASS